MQKVAHNRRKKAKSKEIKIEKTVMMKANFQIVI